MKSRKTKLKNSIEDVLKQKNPNVDDIISVVEHYERNNLRTITKLKKKKSLDIKKINGALRQTINAHGPITKEYITSASKRIYGSLLIDKQNRMKRIFIMFLKFIGFF
jgi:hypothetical protein